MIHKYCSSSIWPVSFGEDILMHNIYFSITHYVSIFRRSSRIYMNCWFSINFLLTVLNLIYNSFRVEFVIKYLLIFFLDFWWCLAQLTNIGSSYGLFPDDIKPLPEPFLIYHQQGLPKSEANLTRIVQDRLIKNTFEGHTLEIRAIFPIGQWVKFVHFENISILQKFLSDTGFDHTADTSVCGVANFLSFLSKSSLKSSIWEGPGISQISSRY